MYVCIYIYKYKYYYKRGHHSWFLFTSTMKHLASAQLSYTISSSLLPCRNPISLWEEGSSLKEPRNWTADFAKATLHSAVLAMKSSTTPHCATQKRFIPLTAGHS